MSSYCFRAFSNMTSMKSHRKEGLDFSWEMPNPKTVRLSIGSGFLAQIFFCCFLVHMQLLLSLLSTLRPCESSCLISQPPLPFSSCLYCSPNVNVDIIILTFTPTLSSDHLSSLPRTNNKICGKLHDTIKHTYR